MSNGWNFSKTPTSANAYQSPNRRLSQLLLQSQIGQPRQQRRGKTGQIADFLQSGLGAYLMQKDMGQQQAAQQAFAQGAQGGDLKGAMTALQGLSDNPYAQNRLQNLLMRQIGQGQKEKQRLKELESAKGLYQFQQEHKAFQPKALVPGRDVALSEAVQAQKVAQQEARKTSWGPAVGRPGFQQSTTGQLKAMPQSAEQQFQSKLKLQKESAKLKPMNVNQANAGLYADRIREADAIISDPVMTESLMSLGQNIASGIPGFGNVMVSPEYQQATQAKRNLINAIMRRESGAVISDAEFANAEKQYIPQRGDSTEVLAQKVKNRQTALAGIARAAGPQYQQNMGQQVQQQTLSPNVQQILGQQPQVQQAMGQQVQQPQALTPQEISQLPRVENAEQAFLLPPGTPFITKDGKFKISKQKPSTVAPQNQELLNQFMSPVNTTRVDYFR